MLAVRKAFYAVVAVVTLGLSSWAVCDVLMVGGRRYIFTEAGHYYSPRAADSETDEIRRKNDRAVWHTELAWALPLLVVNVPMFWFFAYPEVKKWELPPRDTSRTA